MANKVTGFEHVMFTRSPRPSLRAGTNDQSFGRMMAGGPGAHDICKR